MNVIRTRTVVGSRPATVYQGLGATQEVPEGWPIYNAPRPLYGDVCWTGDFQSGIFYAAVDPESTSAAWATEENRRLAAIRLEYISEEDAFAAGRARLIAEVTEEDNRARKRGNGFDEAERARVMAEVAQILDAPSSRNWVVNSQLDFMNRQQEA